MLAHTEGPQKVNALYIRGTRKHTVLTQSCCLTTKPFDQLTHGTYSYHTSSSGTADSSSAKIVLSVWVSQLTKKPPLWNWELAAPHEAEWADKLSRNSISVSPSREPAQQQYVNFFLEMLFRAKRLEMPFTTGKMMLLSENPPAQALANSCISAPPESD